MCRWKNYIETRVLLYSLNFLLIEFTVYSVVLLGLWGLELRYFFIYEYALTIGIEENFHLLCVSIA